MKWASAAVLLTLLNPHIAGAELLVTTNSLAGNVRILASQIQESCTPEPVYRAPLTFADAEGRLAPELRKAASAADPLGSLTKAAKRIALGDFMHGLAFADLSVTGRKSYGRFKVLHQTGVLNEGTIVALLRADPDLAAFSQAALTTAAGRAIDRAYRVANVLPYGHSPERADLGWIAVSGEDDSPYRPVNVPSAEFPQYDLRVNVGGHPVRTRFMIAETSKDPEAAPSALRAGRSLPETLVPQLSPDAKVLLYVHGMDSRLEEAADLARAMREVGKKTGENWTVISMDLPSSGYAQKIDYRKISPITDIGEPRKVLGFNDHRRQNVPILDFVENFVVSFVDTLDPLLGLKDRIQAVIGGSLGGNVTFRMGRRKDLPWLKNLVTWSPASIWDGFADHGDPIKETAVAMGWRRAGGKPANLEETPDQRATFLKDVFAEAIQVGPIMILPSQPDQWWRPSWPCSQNAHDVARAERWEIYNRNFRLWHWRLGTEQLIYTQQDPPGSKVPRYLENRTRMLLLSGAVDDYNFTHIYSKTLKAALQMTATPGRAIFLQDTGHSIHNERPRFLAGEITRFLNGDPQVLASAP
ncbi:MAG TPA: hypothetical protein VL588_02390 [Bdellovibrionota bacterium]|nr:hypothetical protein [Bdellovibrionota bacterium]